MLIRLKSPAEIEGFAKAGKIAATILAAVLAKAKPGTTTGELDELARSMCADANVKPAFLPRLSRRDLCVGQRGGRTRHPRSARA